MKAFFFTLLLFSGLATAASAQMRDRHAERPGTGETSSVRVDEMTRQMCDRLHLNEAQYIRLRSANQIKLARLDEIQWQYKNDPTQRHNMMSELEAQYESECSRIMTPSQLSLYKSEQQHDSVPTQPNQNEGGLG
jgi:TolA-binding protein